MYPEVPQQQQQQQQQQEEQEQQRQQQQQPLRIQSPPRIKASNPILGMGFLPGVPFQSDTQSELGSRSTKRVSGQC